MKNSILLITPSLHIGGLEMVIAHICRYIDRGKFDVHVCCLKEIGSIGKQLKNEGHCVQVLKKSKYLRNNYTSWVQMLTFVRKHNIKMLHSHTLDSLIDCCWCRLFNRRIRVIHTFHYGNYPNLPKKYLYLERICSRFADKLVTVGNEQKKRIGNALNIRREGLVTVWNGVPESKIEEGTSVVEKYRQDGKLVVGTVCTLIEQKGLTSLIDVAFSLKKRGMKVSFLVAGEGHLRSELEEKARRLGIREDVIFMGWVENAAESFIPYVDIFLLPSLWEAMSVVVLEAMEAGKPVVVTDVGENRHIIENGIDGFIVPKMDVHKMADEIKRLIYDKALREKIGKNARLKVRAKCSVQSMVKNYERLYLEVLGERK